ncbi:hypothetical protein J6590_001088 [Homalodisca vitripennis]|nr:hypothetical protein J6590_001088 [Homalodisca vitripennis]
MELKRSSVYPGLLRTSGTDETIELVLVWRASCSINYRTHGAACSQIMLCYYSLCVGPCDVVWAGCCILARLDKPRHTPPTQPPSLIV